MTVRLRPHHLLCLLTYVGKGYSPSFTANYDCIAERLSRGEAVTIIMGPDDICAPLLDDPDAHCRRARVADRDRRAARDLGATLGLGIEPGGALTLDAGLRARMRLSFARGDTRLACAGCEWSELCSAVANSRYEETRVRVPEHSDMPAAELHPPVSDSR